DVAVDLETLSSASTTTTSTQTAAESNRRRIMLAVLAVAVLVGMATFLAGKFSAAPFKPAIFHRITYERGSIIAARFAPDGQSVIYDAAWEGRPAHLFSTPANTPEPRALDLENAHLFAVSPSGEAALGSGGSIASHLSVLGATLARSPPVGGAP